MRSPILVAVAMCACGNDHAINDDGGSGNPAPRVISGGGIGDGPIDGVVNLYVIDDATRAPIAGAEVKVGDRAGTTDATGLFIAEGLTGPQTVVVMAPAMRSEMWVGANGANITVNLIDRDQPVPGKAEISGSITGFDTIAVTVPNHIKAAIIVGSQTDVLGDPANDIAQTVANQNICTGAATASPCNFTVTTRTGNVALIAAILDIDTKGTATPNDDSSVLIRWAYLGGLDVVAGVNQTNRNLALVSEAMQQQLTISFGTPPLSTVAGVVGVELGDDGVLALPQFLPATATSLLAPTLAVFGTGARYRFTGLSNSGATTNASISFMIDKHLPGPTLGGKPWLAPPTGANITTTGGSWTNSPGATVHAVEYRSGATRALSVTLFDGSTSFTVPAGIALPSGSLTAAVNAMGAPGLDLMNFALDTDSDKIVQFAGQPVML
ncbi:MAG TPA: hypothetical protein VIU61_22590 [Kofleriaceae bacterium]